MKIIAVERGASGAVPASPDLLREEAAKVWRLHMQGVVRQAWFTVGTHEAVLEMECADEDETARTRRPGPRGVLAAFGCDGRCPVGEDGGEPRTGAA
jgi:hypothetical protein